MVHWFHLICGVATSILYLARVMCYLLRVELPLAGYPPQTGTLYKWEPLLGHYLTRVTSARRV